ncbi:MAG TPA: hypothetical protein VHH73_14615 [Verrucomicrobiae bacterium]|nr:hypothetical protein [Verrucomicrobiae bacterium]
MQKPSPSLNQPPKTGIKAYSHHRLATLEAGPRKSPRASAEPALRREFENHPFRWHGIPASALHD